MKKNTALQAIVLIVIAPLVLLLSLGSTSRESGDSSPFRQAVPIGVLRSIFQNDPGSAVVFVGINSDKMSYDLLVSMLYEEKIREEDYPKAVVMLSFYMGTAHPSLSDRESYVKAIDYMVRNTSLAKRKMAMIEFYLAWYHVDGRTTFSLPKKVNHVEDLDGLWNKIYPAVRSAMLRNQTDRTRQSFVYADRLYLLDGPRSIGGTPAYFVLDLPIDEYGIPIDAFKRFDDLAQEGVSRPAQRAQNAVPSP